MLLTQIVIQYTLRLNEDDARVINIAGRQRMLSQKISKSALALSLSSDAEGRSRYLAELSSSLDLWQLSHKGLLQGDPELGLPGSNSRQIVELFKVIEPQYEAIVQAARRIIDRASSGHYDPEAIKAPVAVIMDQEAGFLTGMNDIVFQYDAESNAKLEKVEWIEFGLLVMALAVLALEIRYILWPALALVEKSLAERIEAEAQIKKSHDELLKFAAQVPGMLYQYEITPNGRVRVPFTTDAIKDIFGCTPDEVREDFSPVGKVIHPGDVDRMNAAIAESVKNLSPFQLEYRVVQPGQPVRWVLAKSMPERKEDETIVFHGFNADISEHKLMEEALHDREELFNTTVMSIEEGIVLAKLSGEILLFNAAAERITGYTSEEVLNQDLDDVFHLINSQTRERAHDYITGMLLAGNQFDAVTDFALIAKDGTEKRIFTSITRIKAAQGEPDRIIASFRDINREYELEKQIQGFLDINIDMLCVGDLDGNFHKVNKKFEQVLGYRTEDIVGQNFMAFIHPDDVQMTLNALTTLDNKEKLTGFTNRYRCKDGSYKYIEWNSMPGVGRYLYSSARDVTSQRLLEEQLRQAAIKDVLTGLYNRHYFESIIDEQMLHADRYEEPLSMLLLDLDHFKQVNDTWGHPMGDELLKLTARTVGKVIRESDILIRFGGEEFAVLMPRTPLDGAMQAAEKIRAAIESHPLATVGIRTASIGAAERMKAESYRHWYRRLDEALYPAKQTGRNRVVASDDNEKLPVAALKLEWQLELQSGNAEIDQQHQELFEIGNRLINMTLDGTNQTEIMQQLELLLSHIVNHFASEELILKQANYPGLPQHVGIHKEFAAKAMRLKESYEAGEIRASAFFSFVADDVILNHIMNEDTRFFAYLKRLTADDLRL